MADGPWDFDLHDFKQLLQFLWQQGSSNFAYFANQDNTSTGESHNIFD
jgi:hypothetical protein